MSRVSNYATSCRVQAIHKSLHSRLEVEVEIKIKLRSQVFENQNNIFIAHCEAKSLEVYCQILRNNVNPLVFTSISHHFTECLSIFNGTLESLHDLTLQA